MVEMKRWLTDINRMLKEKKLYHPQGGPIILVQIENEYDIVSSVYGAAGQKYLRWCYELYKGMCNSQSIYIERLMIVSCNIRIEPWSTSYYVQKL